MGKSKIPTKMKVDQEMRVVVSSLIIRFRNLYNAQHNNYILISVLFNCHISQYINISIYLFYKISGSLHACFSFSHSFFFFNY